jgi:hypothetical protein
VKEPHWADRKYTFAVSAAIDPPDLASIQDADDGVYHAWNEGQGKNKCREQQTTGTTSFVKVVPKRKLPREEDESVKLERPSEEAASAVKIGPTSHERLPTYRPKQARFLRDAEAMQARNRLGECRNEYKDE